MAVVEQPGVHYGQIVDQDRGEKFSDCERGGGRECWIFDSAMLSREA